MLPFMRGLIGVEANAITKSILVNPKLPADWDSVVVRNINIENNAYDLTIAQTESSMSARVNSTGNASVEIIFAPALPVGAQQAGVQLNEKRLSLKGTSMHRVQRGDLLTAIFTAVPALLPPPNSSMVGDPNRGLRIISERSVGKEIRVAVEGIVGKIYHLNVVRPHLISSVTGGSLAGDDLTITFDTAGEPGFVRKDIIMTVQ
jgi:hypothetical protein